MKTTYERSSRNLGKITHQKLAIADSNSSTGKYPSTSKCRWDSQGFGKSPVQDLSSAVCVFLYASACFPSPHSESNLSKAAAENQAFSHLTQKPRASHCPSRPCHCPVTSIWPQLEQLPEMGFWPYFLLIVTWDCLNFFKIQNRKFPLSLYHTHTHMLFNLYIWILLFQLQSKLGTIACKLYKSLGRHCIWRQSKWHFSAK